MKYIQPMAFDDFVRHLLTLKNNDVVEFGCDPGVNWPDEVPDINSVEAWYFAKVMSIPEYDSRFILLDYTGGEAAFAIPLNGYSNRCDEDDIRIIIQYLRRFYKEYCEHLSSVADFVFVEMEDRYAEIGNL